VRFLVREFCESRDRAGIPDFRFHDLRHTFATRLVQRGVHLYKVQRLLGHKTQHMTQRYAHHSPESLREGVDVLAGQRFNTSVSTKLAQSGIETVHQLQAGLELLDISGEPPGTRTQGPRLKRAMLYRLS